MGIIAALFLTVLIIFINFSPPFTKPKLSPKMKQKIKEILDIENSFDQEKVKASLSDPKLTEYELRKLNSAFTTRFKILEQLALRETKEKSRNNKGENPELYPGGNQK